MRIASSPTIPLFRMTLAMTGSMPNFLPISIKSARLADIYHFSITISVSKPHTRPGHTRSALLCRTPYAVAVNNCKQRQPLYIPVKDRDTYCGCLSVQADLTAFSFSFSFYGLRPYRKPFRIRSQGLKYPQLSSHSFSAPSPLLHDTPHPYCRVLCAL